MSKEYFDIPKICPICGGETKLRMSADNTVKILYCTNPNCGGKALSKISFFVSKNGLNIKGLSEKTIEKLINWGWLDSVLDIFTLDLHREEWIEQEGYGRLSVDKILNSIAAVRNKGCDLVHFISALSIPLVSLRNAAVIAKIFPTWEEFKQNRETYDWANVYSFGEEIAKNITTFDYSEADYIIEHFLRLKENDANITQAANLLSGKSFAITGKVTRIKNRDALEAIIKENGGEIAKSVTKKTSYLISNDNNPSSFKAKKATDYGVKIISEETFFSMIGQ